MIVSGLSDKLRRYQLAVFDYFATGEGSTKEAQLLCHPDQKLKIMVGWPEDWKPEIIDAVLEHDSEYGKYLDWNPEFIATFLSVFGASTWGTFLQLSKDGHFIDLLYKEHYNLS